VKAGVSFLARRVFPHVRFQAAEFAIFLPSGRLGTLECDYGVGHGAVLQRHRGEGGPRVEGLCEADEEGQALPRRGVLRRRGPRNHSREGGRFLPCAQSFSACPFPGSGVRDFLAERTSGHPGL